MKCSFFVVVAVFFFSSRRAVSRTQENKLHILFMFEMGQPFVYVIGIYLAYVRWNWPSQLMSAIFRKIPPEGAAEASCHFVKKKGSRTQLKQ